MRQVGCRASLDAKSNAVKNPDVLSIILSDDFTLLAHFKRPVYNNKDLIMEIIQKAKTPKAMIKTTLELVGSKLVTDNDVFALL